MNKQPRWTPLQQLRKSARVFPGAWASLVIAGGLLPWWPSAHAQTTGLAAPLATNTPGGVPTLGQNGHISVAQLGGKNLWQFLTVGNSYMYGTGATRLGNSAASLLINDTPAISSSANQSVAGTLSSQISVESLNYWNPSTTNPSVLVANGAENDATNDSCGGVASSVCVTSFEQTMGAVAGWAATAPQNRIMASAAAKTGTWATDSTISFQSSAGGNGTALHATASGATLTFTVPATNNGHIAVYQPSVSGATGTYTLSIGGVQQSYNCGASGAATTTFSSGACGGISIINGPAEQRFDFYNAAWAGQQVTVVVTTTGTAQVAITAVDYVPSTLPSNAGAVFLWNGGASFDSTGNYSAATQTVVNTLSGAGLQVYFVDVRSALLALPGGGVSGATASVHPNDQGYFAMYRATVAEEATAGYQFSLPQSGGRVTGNTGIIYGPYTTILGTWTNHSSSDLFNKVNATNAIAGVGDTLFDNGAHITGRRMSQGTMPDGSTSQYYESVFGDSLVNHWCAELSASYGSVGSQSNFTPNLCVTFSTGDLFTKGYVRGNMNATAIGTAIASAATIAPGTGIVHVTGMAVVSVMTPPAACTLTNSGCTIRLVPDGAFTTATGGGTGGFAIASTAVVGRVLEMTYDPATKLWYASY